MSPLYAVVLLTLSAPALLTAQQILSVPPNGVTCQTRFETAHVLSATDISTALTNGAALSLARFPIPADPPQFPSAFPQSLLGQDDSGATYTLTLPEGCPSFDDIWAYPIPYGLIAMPPDPGSPPPANKLVTTDLALYAINSSATTEADYRNKDLAAVTFCGVVTNSDAPMGKTVMWLNGINANRGGYHQCNAN